MNALSFLHLTRVCSRLFRLGLCSCSAPWTGNACQYSPAATCSNNGQPSYSGVCTCNNGYSGTSCNSCATNVSVLRNLPPRPALIRTVFPVATVLQLSELHLLLGIVDLQRQGHVQCPRQLRLQHRCAIVRFNCADCVSALGYSGSSCQTCATNYYNWPVCSYCLASTTCTGNGACDVNTGACDCFGAHSGSDCSQCLQYYWGQSCSGEFTRSCCVRALLRSLSESRLARAACQPSATNPCNGLGTCSDGRAGTGACTCNAPYRGTVCTDPVITLMTPTPGTTMAGGIITISARTRACQIML